MRESDAVGCLSATELPGAWGQPSRLAPSHGSGTTSRSHGASVAGVATVLVSAASDVWVSPVVGAVAIPRWHCGQSEGGLSGPEAAGRSGLPSDSGRCVPWARRSSAAIMGCSFRAGAFGRLVGTIGCSRNLSRCIRRSRMGSSNGSFAVSKKSVYGNMSFRHSRGRDGLFGSGSSGTARSGHIKRSGTGVPSNSARNSQPRWLDVREALQIMPAPYRRWR